MPKIKKNNKIATDKDDDARKKNVSVLFTLPFGFRIQIYGRSQEKSDPALRYSPEWVGLAEPINSITPLPVRLLQSCFPGSIQHVHSSNDPKN